MNNLVITEQTYADASRTNISFVPRANFKFNPANNTLDNRVNGLIFSNGLCIIDAPARILQLGTGVNKNPSVLVNTWDVTAAYQNIKLPSTLDYEDLDELNDLEYTENLLYQASKKFSW